jgi:hypothetical protein
MGDKEGVTPSLPNQNADTLAMQEDKGRRVATALFACGLKHCTIAKMASGAVDFPRIGLLSAQEYRNGALVSLSSCEEYAFMAGVASVLEGMK